MIRVLIVDDHPVVRAGIRQLVSDERDITVVAEAGSGMEALERLKQRDVDVVLLDISMPGIDGIETLKRIVAEYRSVHVLVLSMYAEEQYARPILKSGAAGYLTKQAAPELLVSALRTVAAGRRFVSPALAEQIAGEIARGDERPAHMQLSSREHQIFLRLAAGDSVSQIAQLLGLSVKTVSTYRTRVMEKTGLTRNAELTMYAIRHGLIESPGGPAPE
jgi:DNA-binding NarL/FixJ family response regulator